jgi:hypothetical protein
MATYNTFSNCMQTVAACNNIFYIRDGHVQEVALVGTGGTRCSSNESLRPGFKGATTESRDFTTGPRDSANVNVGAWAGVPVAELDTHPIFLTMPVVRTTASDGTELRRYVNGQNISSCSAGGSVFTGPVDIATYNTFSNCMQTVAACNNIFYIRDGHVQEVALIGTGGARCSSNESLKPGFRGSTNVR